MNLNLTTLTPLHVGNGEEMQGNYETLYFREEGCVVVIDEKKVLEVIGEENISQWVACIEKQESLLALLRQRKPDLQPTDVARRIVPVQVGGDPGSKAIREQLHNGTGRVLLPGSSLKGAIRTVMWAATLFQRPTLVEEQRNLGRSRRDRFQFNDATLAKTVFGDDPSHDIFRLLQMGDAHFDQTACYKTEVVNLGWDDWEIKHSITQWIEAIPADSATTVNLRYNERLAKKGRDLFNSRAGKLRVEQLFPLINAHTLRLLDNEISYWRETENSPLLLGTYVEDLEELRSQVQALRAEPGGCILRLGWGIGFRSMTGDWHSLMEERDYDRLVQSLRPKHDVYLTFPKTTRMVAGGKPLGFVKFML